MKETRIKTNREHKDRLFKMAFKEKGDLLDLYNAMNGTDYQDPDALVVNTIEDAVYMGMKNDISFIVSGMMALYEHQSTPCPNLPLRGLFYFANLYRKETSGKDIYGSRRIPLPEPQFIVFYNGLEEEPERQVLRLSDAFPAGADRERAGVECRAEVVNINLGHNKELMENCRRLKEYAQFVAKLRECLAAGEPLERAVNMAVDDCIRAGILKELLQRHRAEVIEVVLYEYDEAAHIENERGIAFREGLSQGLTRGRTEGMELGLTRGRMEGKEMGELLKLLSMISVKHGKGKTLPEIAADLEEDAGELEPLYRAVVREPGKSPEEILEGLRERR